MPKADSEISYLISRAVTAISYTYVPRSLNFHTYYCLFQVTMYVQFSRSIHYIALVLVIKSKHICLGKVEDLLVYYAYQQFKCQLEA